MLPIVYIFRESRFLFEELVYKVAIVYKLCIILIPVSKLFNEKFSLHGYIFA